MSNSGTQLGLKHRILVSTNRCDTLETMHEWTLIYMARVMAHEVFWAVKFHSKQWFHPSETEKLVWCHICNMFHIGQGGDSTLIRRVSATDVWNLSPCSGVGKPKKDTLLWSYHFLLIYCIVLYCIRDEEDVCLHFTYLIKWVYRSSLVLLCLCKEFKISYCCYQFKLWHMHCFSRLTTFYDWG